MNTFNRIVMIILLLVLAAVTVALLLAPYEAVRIAITSLEALQEFLLYSEGLYLWYVGILAAFLVVLLVLLYLELRRTRQKTVLIRAEGAGKVRIGVDSVMHSLEYRIDELPGIRDVRPRIISRGKDVQVIIDLRTSPTVNIPQVTQQIVDLAHEIVEEQLGVKIRGKVEINVAHEPFPRGTLAPGVAQPQWTEPVAPARTEQPAHADASPRGEPAVEARAKAQPKEQPPKAQPATQRHEPTQWVTPEVVQEPPVAMDVIKGKDEFDLQPRERDIMQGADQAEEEDQKPQKS